MMFVKVICAASLCTSFAWKSPYTRGSSRLSWLRTSDWAGDFSTAPSMRMRDARFRTASFMAVTDSTAQEEANITTTGLPDKSSFETYFNENVESNKEISKTVLLQYRLVQDLLDDGSISKEDFDALWISSVADTDGLLMDEAYEVLCMLNDLPEPEEKDFLDSEFKKLVGEGEALSFFQVLAWEDVKDMIAEKVISMEDLSSMWRDVAGSLDSTINRRQFGKLNRMLDDAVDEAGEGEDEEEERASVGTGAGADAVALDEAKVRVQVGKESSTETESETVLASAEDIWRPDFDVQTVFDAEALQELTDYFEECIASSPSGSFQLSSLLEWPEMQDNLQEGLVDAAALKTLWAKASRGSSAINIDTFLRLNVELDLLMDEAEAKAKAGTDKKGEIDAGSSGGGGEEEESPEEFYRSEFRSLAAALPSSASGERLLSLEALLQWPEIAELMDEGEVQREQVEKMFAGLPKQEAQGKESVFGITEDTFVAFNGMLDVLISATSSSSSSSNSKGGGSAPSVAKAPSLLVSEPALPAPASGKELKFGSMEGMGRDIEGSQASSGLSDTELELMQQLDKADNMLSSGSYCDFDQLIGDVNDPRLAALRDEPGDVGVPGGRAVGDTPQLVQELLDLSRAQARCGLDKPSEEDAGALRSLFQALADKTPKVASTLEVDDARRLIDGRWKLLYTNSEMFEFYNGITGFANVFPASRFEEVSTEYRSDGYLSESKYFEKLSTPLGLVNAEVFCNWELVKEMSFMTNENSIVLRNYCNKVLAGPMEYRAEENWKSLRTMAMNELVYIDSKVKVMRNIGALRIFFVYERI